MGKDEPRITEFNLRRGLGLLSRFALRAGGHSAIVENQVMPPTVSNQKRTRAASLRRGLDIALVLVVFGVTLGTATGALDTGTYSDSVDALNIALAALASLPLIAVRRAPLAVFGIIVAAIAALNVLGAPMSFGAGPSVALYFLGLLPAATPKGRWLTVASIAGAFILLVYTDRLDNSFTPAFIGIPAWVGVYVIGDWIRLRRERIADLEDRATRAEREAEQERRLAVAEERTRIARDLHDSAGHSVNVILVQAGAARLLAQKDPERARQAIETIEEVAREIVGEIDQLVHALREEGLTGQRHSADEMLPGFAALDRLIDRNREAGLDVSVELQGEPRTLPPGVDQAAYRILQESLTNAVRHGAGSAEIKITFAPQVLELAVANPTRREWAPMDGGHGIVGMRERAALLGGSLSTEGGDGTFNLRAELPYGSKQP